VKDLGHGGGRHDKGRRRSPFTVIAAASKCAELRDHGGGANM